MILYENESADKNNQIIIESSKTIKAITFLNEPAQLILAFLCSLLYLLLFLSKKKMFLSDKKIKFEEIFIEFLSRSAFYKVKSRF
jgi:hypothetical protein